MSIDSKRIQFRRGTSEALAAKNEVLSAGEICLETDTGKFKFGDGSTAWNSLAYSGLSMPSNEGVYVLKNGEYVQAQVVQVNSEWLPEITNTGDIILAVDEDMQAYQLTGVNVEVNESEEEEQQNG